MAGSGLYWFRIHLLITSPDLMVTVWGFGFRAWSFRLRAECSHSILQGLESIVPLRCGYPRTCVAQELVAIRIIDAGIHQPLPMTSTEIKGLQSTSEFDTTPLKHTQGPSM